MEQQNIGEPPGLGCKQGLPKSLSPRDQEEQGLELSLSHCSDLEKLWITSICPLSQRSGLSVVCVEGAWGGVLLADSHTLPQETGS